MTWASLWDLKAGLLLLISDIALHLAVTLPYLTGKLPASLLLFKQSLKNNNKSRNQSPARDLTKLPGD